MMIFSFASKLLGFIREALIAAKFGLGAETDAFFIAFTAITLLTTFLTNSIKTTMIPVVSEVEAKEGKKGKIIHTNNLLNIVMLISLILVVLGYFLAPLIIRILAHGFKGEQFKLTVFMMRIGLPAVIFAGIVGVYRGYLQSELMFIESALTQFPFNFVYILFLIFLSSIFGIKGLMLTSVLAIASQLLLQIPAIKKAGYSYNTIINIKDRYVKKIIYLVPPILLSTAVSDL